MAHASHDPTFRFCVRCGGELALAVVKPGEPERLVCQRCKFVQYLNPRVAACSIIRQDGKLVLLKRAIEPSYGKWVFPGGFVDRGETLEHAAVREAREEAGVEVAIDELVGAYSYEGSPVVVIVFAGTILAGSPRPLDEALDVGVFSKDQIPWDDLAFPSTKDSIRDYCQRFWP